MGDQLPDRREEFLIPQGATAAVLELADFVALTGLPLGVQPRHGHSSDWRCFWLPRTTEIDVVESAGCRSLQPNAVELQGLKCGRPDESIS